MRLLARIANWIGIKWLCVLTGAGLSAALPDVNADVEAVRSHYHYPKVAVAVVMAGEQLAEGYDATADTQFGIGSCTKAFTAMVIAQMVEEGLLDWDTPASHYLPDFVGEFTVRDLVAHRTGLPRADELWYGQGALDREELLSCVATLEPQEYEFSYSNLMYGVLGVLIEERSGQTWGEAVQRRIFDPLQMTNSSTDPEYPFGAVAPAGGVHSTADDMLKWLRFQLSTHPLALKTQMPQVALADSRRPYCHAYALGWFLGTYEGRLVVEHSGAIDGYMAHIALFPNENLGIAILAEDSGESYEMVAELAETLQQAFLT